MSPHNTKPSSLTQFLAEMRRRHVGRFSIGYAAAAFVLLQLAEIVFPAFGLHDIWLRVLVVAVVLAFLPAVVLAWVFDLTSEGLRRTEELPRSSSDLGRGSLNARVALVVVSFLTVGGLGVWVMGTSALSPTVNPEGPISDIALTEYDPAQPVTSVAVLALDDLTEGGGQAYFTTGMQEELIAQLSMVSGLRVASRTSAARYAGTPTQIPAIGRELGVDAIIEGSVRRDLTNDSVRITVQLIHAASDTHIWTGQYNRHFTDVLNLQSEVAVEIVRAVQGEITPEDETRMRYAADKSVAPEALDAYLRGNEAYDQGTPEGYRAAMGLYGQAVEADSGFAPAVAGLAGSRFLVTMDGPEVVEGELERAREEARRALELDPTSSMVREVFTLIDGNISEVMPSHTVVEAHGAMDTPQTRVISIPGTSDSIVINLQGMDSTWMGAVSRIGKALEMRVIQRGEFEGDAEGRARQFMAARRLLSDGQFDGASQVLEEMLDDEPAFAPGWEMLVKSEVGTGDIEDLVAAIVGWSEAGGPGAPDEASVDDLEDAVAADGMRGYWAWTLDRLEAQASLGAPVSAVERATAHAALGHKEEALAYLAEGLRSRDRQLLTLQADPVWDSFRRLPEFQAIAREARLMRSAPTRRGPGGGN